MTSPVSFLQTRIKKLQRFLTRWKCDGCIIEDPIDLYYLTGLKLSCGTLLVSKKQVCLFVDGRYIQSVQEHFPFPSFFISEKSVKIFIKEAKIRTLGFDSKKTTYDRFCFLEKQGTLQPIPGPLARIRTLKDQQEIKYLKESAELLQRGFLHIKKELKEGITEKELALAFELFCLKEGGEGLSFEPIIAFGISTAMPHYRAGTTRLKKGDPVLIDIGVVKHNYHSDMTRMVFFGKFPLFLQKMYCIVQEAQKAALNLCRPGVALEKLDKAAREVMRKENVEEYFVHSLGHGVGLEVHEFPRVSSKGADRLVKLEAGMVITIEPGLYFPGKGGVRHEDTILITEEGFEYITVSKSG